MKATTEETIINGYKLQLIPRHRMTIFGRILEWRWKVIAMNGETVGTSAPEWFCNKKDCKDNLKMLGKVGGGLL